MTVTNAPTNSFNILQSVSWILTNYNKLTCESIFDKITNEGNIKTRNITLLWHPLYKWIERLCHRWIPTLDSVGRLWNGSYTSRFDPSSQRWRRKHVNPSSDLSAITPSNRQQYLENEFGSFYRSKIHFRLLSLWKKFIYYGNLPRRMNQFFPTMLMATLEVLILYTFIWTRSPLKV